MSWSLPGCCTSVVILWFSLLGKNITARTTRANTISTNFFFLMSPLQQVLKWPQSINPHSDLIYKQES